MLKRLEKIALKMGDNMLRTLKFERGVKVDSYQQRSRFFHSSLAYALNLFLKSWTSIWYINIKTTPGAMPLHDLKKDSTSKRTWFYWSSANALNEHFAAEQWCSVWVVDIHGRSQPSYTAPCNGVVSHGAQIEGLLVSAKHTRKNKRNTDASTIFPHHAAFYACLSSR